MFLCATVSENRCRGKQRLVESDGCWGETAVHPFRNLPSGTEVSGLPFYTFPALVVKIFITWFEIQHTGQVEHQSATLNSCCILCPSLGRRAETFGAFSDQNCLDTRICCCFNCGVIYSLAQFFFPSNFSAFPGPFIHNMVVLFYRNTVLRVTSSHFPCVCFGENETKCTSAPAGRQM